MIRFKNGGLFNLDFGQFSLGKLYLAVRTNSGEIFLGTSRF